MGPQTPVGKCQRTGDLLRGASAPGQILPSLAWLFSLKERDFGGQQGSPALLHRASCAAATLGGRVPPTGSAKGGTRPASLGLGDKTRAPAAPEAWQ